MRCEILSTGDEVLTGQIVDTNAAFLAEQLSDMGFDVARHTTVGDDRAMLKDAFIELGKGADIVLCTGGLGPTVDDLSSEVVAEVVGSGMKLDAPALENMEAIWKRRGRPMPENNRKQALIPEPSEVLVNPIGTAPGFAIRIGRATFFFMPGVPREMKKMFADQVAPRIEKLRKTSTIFDMRLLRSFGLTESATDRMLADFATKFPLVKVGFRAHFPEIQVKLTVKGPRESAPLEELDAAVLEAKARLGTHVFSDGALADAIEVVVGKLLVEKKATVTTAESCTGGLLAQLITSVSGSSAYFDQGFVTYANHAKVELLGVSESILTEHGAVSEECARAMAEGARSRAKATYALAITGIAGPTGGTPEKPVGLVYVAIASEHETRVRKLDWCAEREQIRRLSATLALDLLRRELMGRGDEAAGNF